MEDYVTLVYRIPPNPDQQLSYCIPLVEYGTQNHVKYGSQTAGTTESSVQIQQNGTSKQAYSKNLRCSELQYSNILYEMKDQYHRKNRLAYWIKRINTDLEEPDNRHLLVISFRSIFHYCLRSFLDFLYRCY
jgi:hypothetical protein